MGAGQPLVRSARSWESKPIVDWLKQGPAAPDGDGVRLAGEPERAARAERSQSGIVIDPQTWRDIVDAGRKVGVDLAGF